MVIIASKQGHRVQPKILKQHKNRIPKMTHKLSSGWNQPSTSRIEIDDTSALMSVGIFEALMDYSVSFPSGVYEGKMWRRCNGLFGRAFIARGGKPEWMLCWYGYSDKPGQVSNNMRKIILIDRDIDDFIPSQYRK